MQKKYLRGRPTIGVLTGWQYYRTATNLSYLAPVFRGISRAARDLGCNLLLGCGIGPSASPSDPLRPAWPVPSPETDFVPIGPWNTDGILVANPLHSLARSNYIQELISQGHPVLFIGSGEDGPTLVADNAGGIREAMRHLFDHGHRQIAFIAGSQSDLSGDSGDRLSAYQSFLQAHDLEANPSLIAYGRHVYDGGTSAMQQILETGVPFTAVLASNDESALGAMQALENAGRKIPQDVAVIGFDNRLEGAVHEPGLSSVHVPLFDMGYQSLKVLHDHLVTGRELEETVRISTRLVRRESCGCEPGADISSQRNVDPGSDLAKSMLAILQSQAHSLTDEEMLTLCERLIASFRASIQNEDESGFQNTLLEVLQKSMAGDDDAHIWQDAISVLGAVSWDGEYSWKFIHELLDAARLTISAQLQKQYRQSMLRERGISSRLSLLTDRLLEALDENQIYETLESHLPDLNIRTAYLVLFEAQGTDPVAWSVARNVLDLDQPAVRFPTRDYPPPGLFDETHPPLQTLIPLVGYSGQMGFLSFGSEPLDLYGTIVQQLGGAFNMARLYHQAVEDRQLAEDANRLSTPHLTNRLQPEMDEQTPPFEQQALDSTSIQPAHTILIVSGEPNTLELHARIVQLHSLTNRVLKAQNGEQALNRLLHESVDLVLLDLHLPGLDGFGVLEKMRDEDRLRRIPVVVVTGKALFEADMARLPHGVASVLEKGVFSLEETIAHMNAALDRKHRLSGEAQRLVRKAMAFIHEHFAEPITRREIARHVSIAEDYLTYCFRQELGTTPIKYLQRYRVNRARSLLRESDKTITEIARMVGFSDSGYFSRIFHRETGMSPEAFRRS